MAKPKPTDAAPYFEKYISLVKADSPAAAIQMYAAPLLEFYTRLPDEKADFQYAPGKWTIKEVLQHIIDAERIFSYRILRIARKDATPLASFDENSYAVNALSANRSFQAIKEEFAAVRKATDLLILSLSDSQLAEMGISSNTPTTANALCFIAFGHMIHHQHIIEDRYFGG